MLHMAGVAPSWSLQRHPDLRGRASASEETALKTKRELKSFLAMLDNEAPFIESSVTYLDLRVCQALAAASRRENASNYRLVRIAEILGRDQWKDVPLNPAQEFAASRKEFESKNPGMLTENVRAEAMEASAEWLEWLVLTTLWLKSTARPPIPWHLMYHVAQAVVDRTIPLKDIPLMLTIAEHSFSAHMARKEDALLLRLLERGKLSGHFWIIVRGGGTQHKKTGTFFKWKSRFWDIGSPNKTDLGTGRN
jgi:hypothetical protein